MKRIHKIVISMLALIILTVIWVMFVSYHINNAPLNLSLLKILTLLLVYTIIYILSSYFSKYKFLEILKKNTILSSIIAIITILLFYFITPLTFEFLDNNNYAEKNNTTHGTAYLTKEEDLYTFEDVKNPFFSYNKYQANAMDGLYSEIFDKENITDVHISIDRNNLNYLLQNAIDKPTVMANSITIGDYKINYPGLKTKGNSSLRELWKSSNDKFSFTIDFKEYINKKNGYNEKQNLFGLEKISFNNMIGDPTMMKEYLAYYLLTEMGIPTPEYGLANLYINDMYYGVYFMIEPVEDSIVERTLQEKNKTNFLFKIETNGGDLLYNEELDKYIDENGEFNFDSIVYDKNGNVIYPTNNELWYYNGLWENSEKNFEKIVDSLPTLFKSIKKLNELSKIENKNTKEYKQELNNILDTDLLARYWAANVYLVNSDSYLSRLKANYAIYMNQDGKLYVLPWDYNFTFGAHHLKTTTQIVNNNIYSPTIESTLKESPLINVILGNNEYMDLYKKYLNDCLVISTYGGSTSDYKNYQANNFTKIIEQRTSILINFQKRDIQSFYNSEEIKLANNNLKKLISLRSQAVSKQLNNDFTKIETDIDYKTLGGLVSVMNMQWNTKKTYNN